MCILLFIVALIVSVLQLYSSHQKRSRQRVVEVVLRNLIVFMYGVGGIFAFLHQTFFANHAATFIGWATGSPFQYEVGIANLAFGVLGLLCFFYKELFWWATIIATTVLAWGSAIGLHMHVGKHSDKILAHLKMMAWSDFVFPLVILLLFLYHVKMNRIRLR
jgi:hypothetical protein